MKRLVRNACRGAMLAALMLTSPLSFASESDVTVVYWSARDCSWCLHWETSEKAQFEQSEEFRQIRFFVVKSERLADRYTKEMFAPEISWVWDSYSDNGYKTPGRPSWDVYIGKERVAAFYGTKVWEGRAWPYIKSVANKAPKDRLAMLAEDKRSRNDQPTSFADIKNADAVPYLSWSSRRAYSRFLDKPSPRAFAIAPNGAYGFAYGNGAAVDAIANCQPYAKNEECRVYVLNEDIVWKGGN